MSPKILKKTFKKNILPWSLAHLAEWRGSKKVSPPTSSRPLRAAGWVEAMGLQQARGEIIQGMKQLKSGRGGLGAGDGPAAGEAGASEKQFTVHATVHILPRLYPRACPVPALDPAPPRPRTNAPGQRRQRDPAQAKAAGGVASGQGEEDIIAALHPKDEHCL